MIDPSIVVDEKVTHRCTAGHEWETSTWEFVADWLVVDGKHFCLRCCREKLIELGIGREVT